MCLTMRLVGHYSSITQIAFYDSGRRLVSASNDGDLPSEKPFDPVGLVATVPHLHRHSPHMGSRPRFLHGADFLSRWSHSRCNHFGLSSFRRPPFWQYFCFPAGWVPRLQPRGSFGRAAGTQGFSFALFSNIATKSRQSPFYHVFCGLPDSPCQGRITCLSLSYDQSLLISSSEDKTARVWQPAAPKHAHLDNDKDERVVCDVAGGAV